jgi:hypothetical protein
MTTMLSPERFAVPPPHDARRPSMDLMDAERRVGWIDGDRVGFHGFATDEEAAHAAWVAYRTLTRRLARSHNLRPVPVGSEPLALQRDGHDELIVASSGPFATLVRPDDDRPGADGSYGFALSIPPPADDVLVRAMAHLIYRTLRKSGVRWTGRADR